MAVSTAWTMSRRDSTTELFGGNSNWRGPVWFPVNYLLIESLQKFHHYFGDDFKVECPTGSGQMMTLGKSPPKSRAACHILFLRDERRAAARLRRAREVSDRPALARPLLFYEYFHGDNGAGIGASHQTGWTGLVAKLLQQSGE